MERPDDIPLEIWEFAGRLSKLPPSEQLRMLDNFLTARPRKPETIIAGDRLRAALMRAIQ